ncbi:hypothetical protein HPB49_023271 [Dermacentor silvarum]|uniref:Uncharacterized protein n=1 Tax=Dermacentor silvarum TaxID=543639 RepID=A0ACB8CNA6_DERSI|nr:hypothetical protein HPB49_023271 [Dermacentor silvarum]
MSLPTRLQSLGRSGEAYRKKVPRTTVINIVAVAAALVGVTILAFATNGDWLRARVCNSTTCSRYSIILQTSMNRSIDPCRSFTRYVCDGWDNSTYSVRESIYVVMLRRLSQTVRDVNVPKRGQSVVQRATAFYKSCDAILHGDRDELADVKYILFRAGVTWPKRDEQPDILSLLLNTSLVLGWDSVLYVSAGRGGRDILLSVGKGFWIVTSKYERLGSYSQKQRHFEYLRDKFSRRNGEEISFSETIRASEVMTGVLSNAERVGTAVLPIARSWLNDVEVNMTQARTAEAFGAHNFTVDSHSAVIARGSAFVQSFFDLLRLYGEQAVHAYVSWCTVQVAALFTNTDLIVDYYGSREKAILRHGVFCLGRVYIILGNAFFIEFTGIALSKNSRVDVEALLLSVRHTYQRRIEAWGFYDATKVVVANWSSLDTVMSTVTLQEHVAATWGEAIPDMTDSFVRNWLMVHEHSQRSLLGRTVIDSMDMHVTTSYSRDFVLLPLVFTLPVYDDQLPRAVKYAGLGAHTAEAIGELALERYSGSTAIFEAMTCLSKASQPENIASVLNEILSINVLLTAMQNSSHETLRLVNFENYSAVQLLLIAWCFMKCESKLNLFRPVCDTPLQHIADFAREFRCKLGSTLNPHHKCIALNAL